MGPPPSRYIDGVSQRTVLIIEDDADVRDALADALAGAGITAVVAEDGFDGLARLREGARPRVILLDLRMPRLGGEEFLRAMRADPCHENVSVITMTAGMEPAEGEEVLAHLQKPFDLDDLLRIVQSLFEAHAA